MGSLNLDRNESVNQVSRVDKITATTAPNIKDELDNILKLGWNLIGIYEIGGNDFAVYTRPKRQTE